jgi:hypothetical protein
MSASTDPGVDVSVIDASGSKPICDASVELLQMNTTMPVVLAWSNPDCRVLATEKVTVAMEPQ